MSCTPTYRHIPYGAFSIWYLLLEHQPYYFDTTFRIFVDSSIHGEVKATHSCDRNGYQYYLTNLNAGQSYDVQVKVSTRYLIFEILILYVYCNLPILFMYDVLCSRMLDRGR